MEGIPGTKKKRHLARKIIFWILAIAFITLAGLTFYVSRNLNKLVSEALMKGFNSNVISDVYELKFEKLRINIFAGDIRVFNVVLQPRLKPLHDYPYINSSFRLQTSKILLDDVQLLTMVKTGKLELRRIEINKPDIQLWLNGEKNILLPYKDTLAATAKTDKGGKKFINSFSLNKFELVDASFHIINTGKGREFKVQKFNISLNELNLGQKEGLDLYAFKDVKLSIGALSGKMNTGGFKSFSLNDFTMYINTLEIHKSIDTLIFTYADFGTGMKNLEINTADSILHISLKSMDLSYAKKSINLLGFAFKPNLSQAAMVKREKYQKAQFSVAVGTLNMNNINFDTLIYTRKIYVDEVKIDKVEFSLFKDKTKPLDRNKFPQYLGQKITAIPVPIRIKRVKVTGAGFVNVERKEDGKYAKVIIQRGALEAENITNLPSKGMLTLKLSGFVENKAPINLTGVFSYQKPLFTLNCKVGKFNLPDLNQLLAAYTPAIIKSGAVDEITFSGTVTRTNATGTMKFLYHNLDIDLKVADKKWQNSIVAFAANTYLSANNPPSAGMPPKVVNYSAIRDLNKGGFNPVIRSFLSGMKETMIMSKENKKAYKEEKKKWKLGKKDKQQ
jgi:hypothetical protein